MNSKWNWLTASVGIGALGYFVDIYDLVLFSIVRTQSLRDLGVIESQILDVGVFLLNCQMAGLVLGGLVWGILGDKRGRISVLFGSILIYSLANLLNGFVIDTNQYAILRFIAGFGLAGELGAAITLVAESLPKEYRGYGTTAVASFGILGGVSASVLGNFVSWKALYIIGGVGGLLLLCLRWRLNESHLYTEMKSSSIDSGNLKLLFSSVERSRKFLCSVLIGVPIYFVVGILITFAPELGQSQHAMEPINAGNTIFYYYLGLALGDGVSGILSQWFKSRRKVVFLYLLGLFVSVVIALSSSNYHAVHFYRFAFVLGFASGYWALCVTIAAEQFGTNLRATVATSVPNLVRGSLILLTLSFKTMKGSMGLVGSLWCVAGVTFAMALIALLGVRETFFTNMDFVEE